jgi:hypothetical protein
MSYWEFYPVPTAWLDRDHPGQQSLALSGIRSFVGCTYDELRRRVDALIDEMGEPPANSSP